MAEKNSKKLKSRGPKPNDGKFGKSNGVKETSSPRKAEKSAPSKRVVFDDDGEATAVQNGDAFPKSPSENGKAPGQPNKKIVFDDDGKPTKANKMTNKKKQQIQAAEIGKRWFELVSDEVIRSEVGVEAKIKQVYPPTVWRVRFRGGRGYKRRRSQRAHKHLPHQLREGVSRI